MVVTRTTAMLGGEAAGEPQLPLGNLNLLLEVLQLTQHATSTALEHADVAVERHLGGRVHRRLGWQRGHGKAVRTIDRRLGHAHALDHARALGQRVLLEECVSSVSRDHRSRTEWGLRRAS